MSSAAKVASIPVIRIEPSKPTLTLPLKELWDNRELLYFLVWRNVKVLYKQTAIGAAWAILQPFLSMLIFTVVFSKFANVPSGGLPYPIFSFATLLPWTFFAKALNQSVLSVVNNSNLVTKVYFPRLLLPISAVLSGIVDFAISFTFFIAMMAWYGITPGWQVVFVPAFVLMTILTALSVSLWFSAINVRYRDVGQAMPFVIQLWMFASPVAYPASVVPDEWRLLYNLNPMSGAIEGFRWALTATEEVPFLPVVLSALIVLALLYGGLLFFRRMQNSFADVV
jgi:lipopolysaccharide transport system permease protein